MESESLETVDAKIKIEDHIKVEEVGPEPLLTLVGQFKTEGCLKKEIPTENNVLYSLQCKLEPSDDNSYIQPDDKNGASKGYDIQPKTDSVTLEEKWLIPKLETKLNISQVPIVKIKRNTLIEEIVKGEQKYEQKEEWVIPKNETKYNISLVPLVKIKRDTVIEEIIKGEHYYKQKEKENFNTANKYSVDSGCCSSSSDRDIYITMFVCAQCTKCFKEKTDLDKHSCSAFNDTTCYIQRSSYNVMNPSLTQPVCSNTSNENDDVMDLIEDNSDSHSDEIITIEKYYCNICDKSFIKNEDLQKHLIDFHKPCTVHEKSIHACEICDKRFKTKKGFKSHMAFHTGKLPFGCTICGKRFALRTRLSIHNRRHTNKFPFVCDVCNKGFNQSTHLKNHKVKHSSLKPYVCHQCNNSFKTPTLLYTHKRLMHSGNKPFECKDCGKRFVRRCGLNTHRKIHISEDAKPFKCGYCDKRFLKHDHVKLHERTHTGEKPYKCVECGKQFSQKSSLTVHIRVHSNDKPYECKVCGEKMKHSGSLVLHMRTHTKDKPFECKECGKRFAQSSNLHSHMRNMHLKIKGYLCDVCDKSFFLKANLSAHLRLWHGDEETTCKKCNQTFRSKFTFHNHFLTHITDV